MLDNMKRWSSGMGKIKKPSSMTIATDRLLPKDFYVVFFP